MKKIIANAIDKSYGWLTADGCGGWLRTWLIAAPLAAAVATAIVMTCSDEVSSGSGNTIAVSAASRAYVMRVISRR